MSAPHKHRYRMVGRHNTWGCTQGDHNYIERFGFHQAVVMCYDGDAGCAKGWCVDCIPEEPAQTSKTSTKNSARRTVRG